MVLSLVLETIDFVSRTTFVSRKGEEREPAKGEGKRASVSLLQFSSNGESYFVFDGNKFKTNVSLVCTKIYFIKNKLKI